MKTKITAIAAIVCFLPIATPARADDAPMPVGPKNILKTFDTNHDRKLGSGELAKAGPKNMAILAKRYDKDGNGTITLAELGLTEKDLAEPKPKPKAKPKKAQKKKKPHKKKK